MFTCKYCDYDAEWECESSQTLMCSSHVQNHVLEGCLKNILKLDRPIFPALAEILYKEVKNRIQGLEKCLDFINELTSNVLSSIIVNQYKVLIKIQDLIKEYELLLKKAKRLDLSISEARSILSTSLIFPQINPIEDLLHVEEYFSQTFFEVLYEKKPLSAYLQEHGLVVIGEEIVSYEKVAKVLTSSPQTLEPSTTKKNVEQSSKRSNSSKYSEKFNDSIILPNDSPQSKSSIKTNTDRKSIQETRFLSMENDFWKCKCSHYNPNIYVFCEDCFLQKEENMQWTCNNCLRVNINTISDSCGHCGFPTMNGENYWVCLRCKTKIVGRFDICHKCGYAKRPISEERYQKDEWSCEYCEVKNPIYKAVCSKCNTPKESS